MKPNTCMLGRHQDEALPWTMWYLDVDNDGYAWFWCEDTKRGYAGDLSHDGKSFHFYNTITKTFENIYF